MTEMLAREKTRLKTPQLRVRAEIERMIEFLENELHAIEERIQEIVELNQPLSEQCEIMQSVTGVGKVTARSICAYLSQITKVNRAQLAAIAGLAPYNQDSGKRKIQGGRQKVRDPLYMAARAAVMRRMLIHIQSLLKNPEKAQQTA